VAIPNITPEQKTKTTLNNNAPPRLSVALCTYNGASFLSAQLESFLAQSRLPDELVVCDDGSTDATLSILENFAARAVFPVHIHRNTSTLGVSANFIKTISLCSGDFVAFSDQDDVWLSDKLLRALSRIQQAGNPSSTLYCSRLQYVNMNLEPIGQSPIPRVVGFSNAIVENVATGCSVVFGAEIRRLILCGIPDEMIMHDWWAYLVASAFGEITYDPSPTVLYRQHGNNVAGWEPKPLKIWNRTRWLVRRLLADNRGMDSLNQAERFIATYPDIPQQSRLLVEELLRLRGAGALSRLRYVLHPRVERNDAIENFGLKVMLLMRWH
jgi:glycosyltransferase involved in cell wall biosynthesis